ncbi:hypothetical protein STEG23_001971, partial [Scotinomys teguina]
LDQSHVAQPGLELTEIQTYLCLPNVRIKVNMQPEGKHRMWLDYEVPRYLRGRTLQGLDGQCGRYTDHSEVNFEQNNKDRNKMLY